MNKLFLRHIVITGTLLAVLLMVFSLTPLDLLVQDTFYNANTQQWLWDKQEPWARLFFYDGIKAALVVLFLVLLTTLIISRFSTRLKPFRAGLLIVMSSMVLVPAAVSLLKANTNMACPVNLLQYGGKVEHVSLFASYPTGQSPASIQKCFPAGHASGGFALLSLIFLMPTARARQMALIGSLSLGWLMGGYKMAIGDHFLSHTLASMLLAWMIICTLAWRIYRYYEVPQWWQEYRQVPHKVDHYIQLPKQVNAAIDLVPEKAEQ